MATSNPGMSYDAETDVLYIRLNDRPIEQSEQIADGLIVDYDESGVIVGIEVLWVGEIMQETDHADE